MADFVLAQFEESVQLRKRRKKAELLASQLKDEFRPFVETLLRGGDSNEAALFDRLTEVTSNIQLTPDVWLERVFHYDREAYRKDFLVDHSINVAVLAVVLGRSEVASEEERLILAAAAILHDAGMFTLPEQLVHAPRALTEEEWRLVQDHPVRGAELLQRARLKKLFSRLALQEHEREDGSGYPNRLASADIDPLARIISLADTIESMTHARPYRGPKAFIDAYHLLVTFDSPKFPKPSWLSMLKRLTPYPPGTLVRLSNGNLARVVRPHPTHPMRPLVELLVEPGETSPDVSLIDLRSNAMLYITAHPV